MEQPASIELRTGPDRQYRVVAALLWLLAVTNMLGYAEVLAWPWLVLALLLLAVLNPWFGSSAEAESHVQIFRDGTAITHQQRARWHGHGWSSRWATVLRLDAHPGAAPVRSAHVLICASRNSARDYRHLLVWNRFPPCAATPGTPDTQQLSSAAT